jgi:flagellin
MLISSRTNLVHNSAINHLRQNRSEMNNNSQALTTGSRITKSGIDIGGFMVSTRMNQDSAGLQQSIRNINDGISMLQTADSDVRELESLVNRLRELAIQSSNETYSNTDRVNLTTEYQTVTGEIDRLVTTANFNQINIFNNSDTSFDFQVGYLGSSTQRISIDLTNINASTTSLGLTSATTGISNVADAQTAIEETSTAMDSILTMRSYIGAFHQRLEIALDNATTFNLNLNTSESVIADTDYANASAELASTSIREQSSMATMGQARQIQQNVISGLLQS